jgi:hypothetical protein
MMGATAEDIGGSGLRIDTVQLGRFDQDQYGGGAIAAAVGAGKRLRLAVAA